MAHSEKYGLSSPASYSGRSRLNIIANTVGKRIGIEVGCRDDKNCRYKKALQGCRKEWPGTHRMCLNAHAHHSPKSVTSVNDTASTS